MHKQNTKQTISLLAGLLLILSFFGSTVQFATATPTDDEYEENDDFANATFLWPNYYSDLVTIDSDYFYIVVNGDQDVNVTIIYDATITWMNVSLMNETGDILELGVTLYTGREQVYLDALGYDQNITIRVESNYTGIYYDMDIWLYGGNSATHHLDSETEPNNDLSTAYWLDWNNHDGFIQGDDDWYRLPGVNDGMTVHVIMHYNTSMNELFIELYDQYGTPHGYYINQFSDGKELVWTAGGNYPEEFLKISGTNSGDWYNLDIWWNNNTYEDDWLEENDYSDQSKWLSIPGEWNGLYQWDADFYRFYGAEGDHIEIEIFCDNNSNIYVEEWAVGDNRVIQSDGSTDDGYLRMIIDVGSGQDFMIVVMGSNNGYWYNLKINIGSNNTTDDQPSDDDKSDDDPFGGFDFSSIPGYSGLIMVSLGIVSTLALTMGITRKRR